MILGLQTSQIKVDAGNETQPRQSRLTHSCRLGVWPFCYLCPAGCSVNVATWKSKPEVSRLSSGGDGSKYSNTFSLVLSHKSLAALRSYVHSSISVSSCFVWVFAAVFLVVTLAWNFSCLFKVHFRGSLTTTRKAGLTGQLGFCHLSDWLLMVLWPNQHSATTNFLKHADLFKNTALWLACRLVKPPPTTRAFLPSQSLKPGGLLCWTLDTH